MFSFVILVDYPIHFDTISMALSILHFKGLWIFYIYKMVPEDSFDLIAHTDEMWPYAAFHMGLFCVKRYSE